MNQHGTPVLLRQFPGLYPWNATSLTFGELASTVLQFATARFDSRVGRFFDEIAVSPPPLVNFGLEQLVGDPEAIILASEFPVLLVQLALLRLDSLVIGDELGSQVDHGLLLLRDGGRYVGG